MTKSEKRIEILDVLRGFAIVSILLLHNIEHFDIYYFPKTLPGWMVSLDKIIWDSLFFLFGGKSYEIFALMFGVTFAIQLRRQAEKGHSFRLRFLWRMFLLLGFGVLNSTLYQGDILSIYAVLGLVLIPFSGLKDKTIVIIALLLMLQPVEWWNLYYALNNPLEKISDPLSWTYFGYSMEYLTGSSLIKTITGNLTTGKTAVLIWNWENGRFFTIAALFMLGFAAGKRQFFIRSEQNIILWKRIFSSALIVFIPLFALKYNLDLLISSEIIRRSLNVIVETLSNFSFMLILVFGITILFLKPGPGRRLRYFAPFGKMSLSNYVFQSMIGAFIYHGWGLGLYKYTGAAYGLIIGIILTLIMGIFCKWWMNTHRHGPFEYLWHKATWVNNK